LARLDQLGLSLLALAILGHLPRLRLVGNRNERISGLRNALQAENFRRERRRRSLNLTPPIIDHGPHLAVEHTAEKSITTVQGPLLHEYGRHRPASTVELCFNNRPAGEFIGIGLELEDIGLQQKHFEEIGNTLMGLGRDQRKNRIASPVLRY